MTGQEMITAAAGDPLLPGILNSQGSNNATYTIEDAFGAAESHLAVLPESKDKLLDGSH